MLKMHVVRTDFSHNIDNRNIRIQTYIGLLSADALDPSGIAKAARPTVSISTERKVALLGFRNISYLSGRYLG